MRGNNRLWKVIILCEGEQKRERFLLGFKIDNGNINLGQLLSTRWSITEIFLRLVLDLHPSSSGCEAFPFYYISTCSPLN